MTSAPLRRRDEDAGNPGPRAVVSVVSALRRTQGDSSGITAAPLGDLAPNPDNPVARSQDVAALVESVRSVGIIQDLVVVPATTFLALHPQHTDAVGQCPWVILAGHRRRAAAELAGLDEVPIQVRTHLVGERADSVILHENLHRKELSPIEEAQAYSRMIERHQLSQRALAQHTGISQAQISKRLSLLELPEPVRDLVDAGAVPVSDALDLLSEVDEVQQRVAQMMRSDTATTPATDKRASGDIWRDIRVLTSQARGELEREHLVAAAREVAEQEGIEFVVDPADRFGATYYHHELTTKTDISKARKADDLAVAPGHPYGTQRPRYYRISKPAKQPRSQHELSESERDKQRRRAMKSRTAALTTMVTDRPDDAAMNAAIITNVLHGGGGLSAEVGRVAIPLTLAAGLTTTTDPSRWWDWSGELRDLTGRKAAHAAWIIALAHQESAARTAHRTEWGPRDVAYLDWLISRGYTPTEWETQRLFASRKSVQAERDGDTSTPNIATLNTTSSTATVGTSDNLDDEVENPDVEAAEEARDDD